MCNLVPRLLPTNWTNVNVRRGRMKLQARGFEITAVKSVEETTGPDFFGLFRAMDRAFESMQQFVERSFRTKLSRVEVRVNLAELLKQAREKPSGFGKLKQACDIKILTCMQRPLFWTECHFDVNAKDVQIFVEVTQRQWGRDARTCSRMWESK